MGRPPKILDVAVLQIARELFIRDGMAASTREIAAKAGLSEAALFKRYPTKAKLFLSAMLPPQIDTAAMAERAVRAADGREALVSYCLDMLAYYRKAMPVMLPAMTAPTVGLEALVEYMGQNSTLDLAADLTRFLQRQSQLGKNNTNELQAAAGLLVSSMHSLALFELLGVHGGDFPDVVIIKMVDVVWGGLAPR